MYVSDRIINHDEGSSRRYAVVGCDNFTARVCVCVCNIGIRETRDSRDLSALLCNLQVQYIIFTTTTTRLKNIDYRRDTNTVEYILLMNIK